MMNLIGSPIKIQQRLHYYEKKALKIYSTFQNRGNLIKYKTISAHVKFKALIN